MLESVGWMFLLGAVVAFVASAYVPWAFVLWGLGPVGYMLGVILAFVVSPALAGVGVVTLVKRRRKA
jgi:hypothetical protein